MSTYCGLVVALPLVDELTISERFHFVWQQLK